MPFVKLYETFKLNFIWKPGVLSLNAAVCLLNPKAFAVSMDTGSRDVRTGASIEKADAYEMSEENKLNTFGKYTKWSLVASVTIEATKQSVDRTFSSLIEEVNHRPYILLKD